MFIYQLTPLDIGTTLLSVASVIAIYLILMLAWFIDRRGYPNWLSRKVIHIGIGSLIGFTLVLYESLSGPALTLGLFFLPIIIGQIVRKPAKKLISLAKRGDGNRISAIGSGTSAILAYGLIFVLLPERPDIFVSAILAVSWGDGSGELVGKPFGSHKYSIGDNERSLEGSAAVAGFALMGFCISILLFTTLNLLHALPFLCIVTIAVMGVEAISPKWSDNFSIPLSTAILLFFLTPI